MDKHTPEQRRKNMQAVRATDEIADVIIYSIAFANRNNIDISTAVIDKLEKNRKKYPEHLYKGKF